MPTKLSTLCYSVAQCTFAPGAQNSQPTSYDGAVTPLAAGSTPEQVLQAAQLLATGGLVAFPTETVYGLGADASNPLAVGRMFAAKNRPTTHPVIVHIPSERDIDYWATDIPDFARALMRDYWPGPMTLILHRSSNARDLITGGQDTVGLRVPGHPMALRLLTEFHELGGRGVVAPSANRYGAVSPTEASAVQTELFDYLAPTDMILDGGPCDVGVESTIIEATGAAPAILRPGAITAAMIEQSTGMAVSDPFDPAIRVPGSHTQHYSPTARVIVGGTSLVGEGLIAGDEVATPDGVLRLSAPATPEDYARALYAALRAADRQGLAVVRVIPPSGDGVAIAIRDRIMRSAATG